MLRASPCTVEEHLQRLPSHLHHLEFHAEFPELIDADSLYVDCGSHDVATLIAALRMAKGIQFPKQLSMTNPSLIEMAGTYESFQGAIWDAVRQFESLVIDDRAEVPSRQLSRAAEPHAMLHALQSSPRLQSLNLFGPR